MTFRNALGITLILIPLSLWAGMRHCYWAHSGWCADLEPIGAWFFGVVGTSFFSLFCSYQVPKYYPSHPFLYSLLATALGVTLFGSTFALLEYRRTSYLDAVSKGSLSQVKLLTLLGAHPDLSSSFGGADALYLAVEKHRHEVLKHLLEHGGNPNRVGNCYLYSPLSKAYIEKDQEAVQLLRKYGAKDPCSEKINLLVRSYDVDPSEFKLGDQPALSKTRIETLSHIRAFGAFIDFQQGKATLQLENTSVTEDITLQILEARMGDERVLYQEGVHILPTQVKSFTLDYEKTARTCSSANSQCSMKLFIDKTYPVVMGTFQDRRTLNKRLAIGGEYPLCLRQWALNRKQGNTGFLEFINFSDEPILVTELGLEIMTRNRSYGERLDIPGRFTFEPHKTTRVPVSHFQAVSEKVTAFNVICAKWGPRICGYAKTDVDSPSPHRCRWITK